MDRYFVVETPLPNCNKGWKISPPSLSHKPYVMITFSNLFIIQVWTLLVLYGDDEMPNH